MMFVDSNHIITYVETTKGVKCQHWFNQCYKYLDLLTLSCDSRTLYGDVWVWDLESSLETQTSTRRLMTWYKWHMIRMYFQIPSSGSLSKSEVFGCWCDSTLTTHWSQNDVIRYLHCNLKKKILLKPSFLLLFSVTYVDI